MHTTSPTAHEVLSRADLLALGYTGRGITAAVRSGALRRLRRDHYVAAGSETDADTAVRVGGRLACVSLLAGLGVFVLDRSRLHVHVDRSMSRLRGPSTHRRPLRPADRSALRLHWGPLLWPATSPSAVDIRHAVACAIRCQSPRASIATLDSLLFLRVATWEMLLDVFAALPRRYAVLLALVDPVAESGPETLLRLLLRQMGVAFQAQAVIDGVGRVDFLVDGRLIVECDSRAFHEGWAAQLRDRRRDLAAASLGYPTIRPVAQDIIDRPDIVVAAIRGMLRGR